MAQREDMSDDLDSLKKEKRFDQKTGASLFVLSFVNVQVFVFSLIWMDFSTKALIGKHMGHWGTGNWPQGSSHITEHQNTKRPPWH